MNTWVGMGRLCADPEIRYTQDGKPIARYRIAVTRKNGKEADFINCVAFDRRAEFAERYLKKGTRINVVGEVRTGSYKNKDGINIPTFDIIVNEQEFSESRAAAERSASTPAYAPADNGPVGDGWMEIPEGVDSELLPFN